MPATSEKQKTLACMALAIKRGEMKKGYSQAAAKMAESMSEEQLEHYCKAPVKEK